MSETRRCAEHNERQFCVSVLDCPAKNEFQSIAHRNTFHSPPEIRKIERMTAEREAIIQCYARRHIGTVIQKPLVKELGADVQN